MAKELQKPFTSPSTPFWKKKPTLKQVIMAIIISLLFAMGQSAKTFFDKRWEKGEFAYDIKVEYFIAHFAGGGRRILVTNGWDPDGIPVSLLRWIHSLVYESAIKKIPENVGERAIWDFNYLLYPIIISNAPSDLKIWMPKAMTIFYSLIHDPMQSTWLNEVDKYNSALIIFSYFFSYKNYPILIAHDRDYEGGRLIKENIKFIQQMDVHKVIKDHFYEMMPIRYGGALMAATFVRIKYNGYACNRDDIHYYLDAKKILTKIALKYREFDQIFTQNQRQEMLQIAYNARDMNITLREALLDKCKLDIQALEQQ